MASQFRVGILEGIDSGSGYAALAVSLDLSEPRFPHLKSENHSTRQGTSVRTVRINL